MGRFQGAGMMDYEFTLRAAAVVAAVALVAGPSVVAYGRQAIQGLSWPRGRARSIADDAHTVVEIARRLQAAGSKRGVELCQQLLDVMLQPEQQAKK
jgi:hypothetical protein